MARPSPLSALAKSQTGLQIAQFNNGACKTHFARSSIGVLTIVGNGGWG